jgi:bleomycin hydrolase
MPETLSANSTAQMSGHLRTLLRQDALKLRGISEAAGVEALKGAKAKKATEALTARLQEEKVAMLTDVYHILALCLGVPPTSFEWKGKTYTPVDFYKELLGYDLEGGYVMVMNDPSREYYKVYEIQYDRHMYDGQNWVYLNLPVDRIKEMAIASIKDNVAMYFSCDVGMFLDRKRGVADLRNFDYDSLLGVSFTMDKKERVMTHASGSSHAMTLIAVDLVEGKPVKWMVENSWGSSYGYQGFLIMTNNWFNEYMFRVVLEEKYIPANIRAMLDQKPIMLPAWDPMFAPEE